MPPPPHRIQPPCTASPGRGAGKWEKGVCRRLEVCDVTPRRFPFWTSPFPSGSIRGIGCCSTLREALSLHPLAVSWPASLWARPSLCPIYSLASQVSPPYPGRQRQPGRPLSSVQVPPFLQGFGMQVSESRWTREWGHPGRFGEMPRSSPFPLPSRRSSISCPSWTLRTHWALGCVWKQCYQEATRRGGETVQIELLLYKMAGFTQPPPFYTKAQWAVK